MKKKNTFLRVGLVLTALVVGFIVLGLFWTPYSPNAMDFSRLLPASAAHPMGTDKFGRDILSRVMVGAGDTLLIRDCRDKAAKDADFEVEDATKGFSFKVRIEASERLRKILLEGGLINFTKENAK